MFETFKQKDNQLKILSLVLGMVAGILYASANGSFSSEWSIKPAIKNFVRTINETEEFLVPDDTTVADDLAQKIPVLCWMYLEKPNYDVINAINITWGKRCTKTLFLTNFKSNATNMIDIQKNIRKNASTVERIVEAYRVIYRNYRDAFDWYLKTEEDTYVVVENLRYFLYAYDPLQPLSFGHRVNDSIAKYEYFANEAGYVLSKKALQRLNEGFNDKTKCKPKDKMIKSIRDDIFISQCLQEMGVIAVESRENKTMERFIDQNLDTWLLPNGKQLEIMHQYSTLYL